MDFIGGCEGRWRRNKVAQPEDGGAGFNTKTRHQVDGSNGNGEMRGVGCSSRIPTAATVHSPLTCTCKSRIFAQQAAVSAGEERKCPTFHFPSAVLLTSRYASRGRVWSSPKSCTPATAVDSGKYHPLDPQVVFSTHRVL